MLDDDGQNRMTGNEVADRSFARENFGQESRSEIVFNPFAYWDGRDLGALTDFMAEWRRAFPRFTIFGDEAVRPLVEKYFGDCLDLYDSIAIPAAKSDVARLLLLHEYGGLYVDCHCGVQDAIEIQKLLSTLRDQEAVLIERRMGKKPRPPDEHFFINSILFFRARSPLTYMIARQALANLSCLREFEQRFGWTPYHIAALSGPMLLTSMMVQPRSGNREIRKDFRDRIHVVREESAPIVRDRHRTYTDAGQHWSERQERECLFKTAERPVLPTDRRPGRKVLNFIVGMGERMARSVSRPS